MNEQLMDLNQERPKKFSCNICDFLCNKFSKLQIHKSTTKHKERVKFEDIDYKMTDIFQNRPEKFCCKTCDYSCSKFSRLKMHYSTDKHKNNVVEPKQSIIEPNKTIMEPKQYAQVESKKVSHDISCQNCDKHFKSNSGLWYHTKKCQKKIAVNEEKPDYPQLVASLLSRNLILQDKLNEKNNEIQIQLLELVKEGKIINNVNNNINNVTNVTNEIVGPTTVHFNLNLYLNEECKDAVNLIEFAKSVDLQLSDLEATGELGYVDGLSNIIIKSIKKIDVNKRPIHCSDLKRETIYVKHDNIWKKEDENNVLLKKAISYIEAKNIQQIPKWIEAHPNCIYSSNKGNTEYLKMVQQCTGGVVCNDETNLINMNKIIKKIIKEMVIKKH